MVIILIKDPEKNCIVVVKKKSAYVETSNKILTVP